MTYNYTKKVYTIPFTCYSGDSLNEWHNIRLIVLRGGEKPDYGGDGYGTPHTVAQVFQYLSTWGIDPTEMQPICYQNRYNTEIIDICGGIGPYSQTKTLPTDAWQPSDPGSWGVGNYTLNKSPYKENAQALGTEPHFIILPYEDNPLRKFINYSYRAAIGSAQGGGAFSAVYPMILWVPEGAEQGNNISMIRAYKLEPGSDPTLLKINHESGASSFAWGVYSALVHYGDIDDYEGTGDDPYMPGGTSDKAGGDGTFDNDSDTIAIPGFPGVSAVDTGFITIYNPTLAQLKALSSYMWNAQLSDIDFWKKLVADPLDLIIGLNIVPCAVSSSGSQSIKVGLIDTGVQADLADSQYQAVDCGSITIAEFWGGAMDYSPYTRASIYLPYIGVRDIDVDDIMTKTIGVVYHIDILSGACTAFVTVDGSVRYQYDGHTSQSIPLSAANYTQMAQAVIGLAGATIGGIAGAAVAAESGAAAVTGTEVMGSVSQVASGAGTTAASVMGAKPTFPRSGAISGPGAQLAVQTPFIILERPRQSLPAEYNSFQGYPSNITEVLGNLTGFTQVDSVHLTGIPATEPELQEIEQLLKAGVIL